LLIKSTYHSQNVQFRGRGIAPGALDQLLKVPQPGKGGGVGIGLLIAKRAVSAMGGSIGIDSEFGRVLQYGFGFREL
jgi:signal transduction histidine kinase